MSTTFLPQSYISPIYCIALLSRAMVHKFSNIKPSSSLSLTNSNRYIQLLFAFLLILPFASSLLRALSYLRTYDSQVYDEVFTGRRFLTAGAVHAVVHEDEALLRDDFLQCDRSHPRTDVCVGRGDVRVVGGGGGGSYEVVVLAGGGQERQEKLKPYTRKWEESVMKTIDEVKVIRRVKSSGAQGPQLRAASMTSAAAQGAGEDAVSEHAIPICDVQHEVPAILFSTGGYTGNVYHEFNDGLIPLFITAQQYPPGEVMLLLLEYHNWWMTKYAEIVSQITNYTVIDLSSDKRVHCFPEITVGLRFHDELAIDDTDLHLPAQPNHRRGAASMQRFQSMLHAAYLPRLSQHFQQSSPDLASKAPKLVIISRSSPRALVNQEEVVAMAEEIGFAVQVLAPTRTTEMVEMYGVLSRCEVVVGVHGAAMTHLVFMRPGATLIQVVPLGTEWAAATYYGEPAEKLGLRYVAYRVTPRESTLYEKYAADDPVLVSPESVNEKGWEETKRIYLEAQDVRVSLPRMRATLRSAYARAALSSS